MMTKEFIWGAATSAYQIEGGKFADGKRSSIWDEFCKRKKSIVNNQNGDKTCEFYYHYKEDIRLLSNLNINNFRFSVSWPRVMPLGPGFINQRGLDFYDRLTDYCLENNVDPWVTLYHWDLPQELEEKGGWTNRDIIQWFSEYTAIIVNRLGDRVKHWMVLNEPGVFTGAGYFLGVHAPGRKGIDNYFPALHHAALTQAEGIKTIRATFSDAHIGTTFSCSPITPLNPNSVEDRLAVKKTDALINRLFIEPLLGYGYPTDTLPFLNKMEPYIKGNDLENLVAIPDFIGIQNYTREVVSHSKFMPYLNAKIMDAKSRNVERTIMNWEIYPDSIYEMIKQFNQYKEVKELYITENGAAFKDRIIDGKINDEKRVNYLKSYIEQVLRAKQEGLKIDGYFVWSLLDNFEWSEGYTPRFGIIHVDFETQHRTIKKSGKWYSSFIKDYKERSNSIIK